MRASRTVRTAMALAFLAGSGCTSLREIPREDYAARMGAKPVHVALRDGTDLDAESAKVVDDTLVCYRRVEQEGAVDEFETVRVPLDDVERISARRLDWYRTGLVGGVSLAVIVAAGLSHHASSGSTGTPPPCKPDCSR